MAKLAPSLLSADFYNLENQIKILEKNKIEYLHLDCMDGIFVPNISFGPLVIKKLRSKTDMIFDTHLMIENPERYIEDFHNSGSDIITIHFEATKHPHRVIQKIKALGKKAGIALNPATSVSSLECLGDLVDLILVMSVNPGFGGQSFIEFSKKKIVQAREFIRSTNRDILLEIDGGIKRSNVKEIIDLGVDLIVSGSDIFNGEVEKSLNEYDKILKESEK